MGDLGRGSRGGKNVDFAFRRGRVLVDKEELSNHGRGFIASGHAAAKMVCMPFMSLMNF